MIKKTFINIFLLTSFFFQNQSIASSNQLEEVVVVAKINNHIITNFDLTDRYKFVVAISRIKANSKQEKQLIISQLLQKMIDEKLEYDESVNLGFSIDESEVNEVVKEIAMDQKKSPDEFKRFFTQHQTSYENYLKQVRSEVLWGRVINKTISPRIKISDAEVKELLELKKIQADTVKLFLSEIFIPTNYKFDNNVVNAKDLSTKLVSELRGGKKFQTILRQFSRSPTAEFGGEIGWVGKNDVNPKIYESVQKLKSGEISDPVMLEDGYYIFKVSDRKTTSLLKEEDMKQIRNNIFSRKLQTEAKSYLIDLRKKAYIEIDQEKLQSVL